MNQIVCPNCHSDLEWDEKMVQCSPCAKNYPVFCDQFPLLVKFPKKYLTLFYNHYAKYLKKTKNRIDQLTKADQSLLNRDKINKNIIAGLAARMEIIKDFQSLLAQAHGSKIASKDIPNIRATRSNYATNFEYAVRDLTHAYHQNKEIVLFEETSQDIIDKYVEKESNFLFLGAATTTFPIDLSSQHNDIYAMDYSVSMPLFLDGVRTGHINRIPEIQTKNVMENQDFCHFHKTRSLKLASNFHYIIGDARNIPLREKSIDVVVMHYFLDTIPIWNYLEQIKKVLNKGGILYHYGPLFYHFNNLNYMYSAQEIKTIFETAGFQILYESYIPSYHCQSHYNSHATENNNWVLVLRYLT